MRAELIEGEMVAMPAAFADHGRTASRINSLVGYYVLQNNLGETYTAETGFLIARNPDTIRAPDFAFIQASRLTISVLGPTWGGVIPDMVAEVVSSGERIKEIDAKVQMWLTAGVCLVWVVWPQVRMMQIYEPPALIRDLLDTEMLSGGLVLPGFTAPVAHIFG
ncbi:MAG: Uma2 family endonuclease [Ktedonobacterales bacterium]|nr:Uma2 family endonuclease [Ktedonobacterales bacterium]